MDNIVLANVLARPVRTAASVVGIALGMVLILVTVGLARGMLASAGEREANLRAELIFLPPGGFGAGLTTMPLTLPVAYADALTEVEGVVATTPVARYVRSGARGIGFELIEGIALEDGGEDPREGVASYAEVTGLAIIEGRLPSSPHELIVDVERARDPETALGARLDLLGREFQVVGVYGPEMGARIKMPLEGMQELLGARERCSWILVRTEPGADPDAVASRIEEAFPGNQIVFTRDVPGMYAQGMPSLEVFLNVVVGLAVFISGLTVFLSLYTAVTERTREIGILKSMGGSKSFIVGLVEAEVLVIAFLGAGLGLAASYLVSWGITSRTALIVRLDWEWTALATALALVGGLLGALYPAFKAAHQDPVEALSYE